MNALQGQPGTAGVAQAMEVERFPVVIRDGQEVAFLTLGAGVGIVLHFVQPLLTGRGEVAA